MWHKAKFGSMLRSKPDAGSAPAGTVNKDDFGVELEKSADGAFIKIFFRKTDGDTAEGWIAADRVEPAQKPERPKLDRQLFAKTCVSAELWVNQRSATAPHFVLADYLIALSSIESGLENPGETDQAFGGMGPFLINEEQWSRFLAESEEKIFGPHDRDDYLDQCYGAAFLTHLTTKELSEELQALGINESGDDKPSAEAGPFVPTIADIFLAQISSARTAAAMRASVISGAGAASIIDTLKHGVSLDEAGLKALLERRAAFFKQPGGGACSIAETYDAIDKRLEDELAAAFELMKKLIPEDVPETKGSADWVEVARKQHQSWEITGTKESVNPGRDMVLQYFRATDSGITEVAPWCGAFVSFCLKETGVEPIAGSARAANWKNWGNVSIPLGQNDVPNGAIVVLSPAPGSQLSGHVAFFDNYLENGGMRMVRLLGGNQSNTVKVSEFPRSKIVAIRWHSHVISDEPDNPLEGGNDKFSGLLTLISEKEGGTNYNAHFGSIQGTKPKLVEMSLRDVLEWQRKFVQSGSESSAAGRYQIIRGTLTGLIGELRPGLEGLFDKELQDRMAMHLLKRRGLGRFLAGTIGLSDFGLSLAKEWASLPVLQQTGGKNKQVARGQSYYSGVGSNKAHITPERVEKVLNELRG
jgi:uncharacterized protein (TIGR02594 family)